MVSAAFFLAFVAFCTTFDNKLAFFGSAASLSGLDRTGGRVIKGAFINAGAGCPDGINAKQTRVLYQ
ncbi:hypothetical protein TMES_14965 [Thalassospira mesophila]|uniref:Uncharacterized protein n=1 Tax=Thalassospira mesophila TaxID=1293891 RepID=A0A1Y2KXJ2_9PROT|nr:hypothetical protein TMES_14965 [Thalassospira mesophila]